MRVNYLKSGAILLSLQLVMYPLQAQSVDADCARVAAAAQEAERREIERIDIAEQDIAEAIERSKTCTDNVLREVNILIPDLLSYVGFVDYFIRYIIETFAKSSCQLIKRSEDRVRSSVPPMPTVPPLSLPTLPEPGGTTTPPTSTSVWDRLGRIL